MDEIAKEYDVLVVGTGESLVLVLASRGHGHQGGSVLARRRALPLLDVC